MEELKPFWRGWPAQLPEHLILGEEMEEREVFVGEALHFTPKEPTSERAAIFIQWSREKERKRIADWLPSYMTVTPPHKPKPSCNTS